MATLHQERFSSGSTGDPVPTTTDVTVKLKKDDTTWKSGSTDADGFVSFDLQTTATLLPGPYYLEITVGDVTKRVHSDVYGVQGREPIGQALAGQFFVNGVLDGVLDELAVTAPGSGMTTRVATGSINLRGTVAPVGTLVTLTHDAAHGSLARIDRIVARLYLDATDFGKVELAILTGTPLASPTAPALTQSTTTVWEEMLADVSVTAGLSTILTANLTDRRTFAGPAVIGSVVQAALDAKQALDATLTAFAAYNTAGLLTQTAADTFTGRTITAADGKIVVTNGNGVSGNPTIGIGTGIAQSSVANLTTDLAAKAALAGAIFTGGVTINNELLVDVTSANAVIFRKADNTEIMRIDTLNGSVNIFQGADLVGLSDSGATVTFRLDPATGKITTGGPIASTGTSPATTLDSNAGSGASRTLAGTDVAGTIALTTGTGPATGVQLTITFASAKSNADYTVLISPGNAQTAGVMGRVYAATKAAASWQLIVTGTALTASTAYIFEYVVVEREA